MGNTKYIDIQDMKYDDGKGELYEEELKMGYNSAEEAAKAFFERYYSFTLKTKLSPGENIDSKGAVHLLNYGLELGASIYKDSNGKYFYKTAFIGNYPLQGNSLGSLGEIKFKLDSSTDTSVIHTHDDKPIPTMPDDFFLNNENFVIGSNGTIMGFFDVLNSKNATINMQNILDDTIKSLKLTDSSINIKSYKTGYTINSAIQITVSNNCFHVIKDLMYYKIDVILDKILNNIKGALKNNIEPNKGYGIESQEVILNNNNGICESNYYFAAERTITDPSMPNQNQTAEIEPKILDSSKKDYEDPFGSNIILGNDQENTIKGNKGNDKIFGGNGADNLEGGDGHDILYGGIGVVIPADKTDTTFCQARAIISNIDYDTSDDTLTGGTGNDKLYGGKGHDKYIFTTGDGFNEVKDANGNEISHGDTISDSDGKGEIIINKRKIGTMIKPMKLVDGKYRYYTDEESNIFIHDTEKNNLVINYGQGDQITIKDFKNLDLDINLEDADSDLVYNTDEGFSWEKLASLATGASSEKLFQDTDSDGKYDYEDPDDDGDGTLTKEEDPDPNEDHSPSDAVTSERKRDYLDGNDTMVAKTSGEELIVGKWNDNLSAGGLGNAILDGGTGNDSYEVSGGNYYLLDADGVGTIKDISGVFEETDFGSGVFVNGNYVTYGDGVIYGNGTMVTIDAFNNGKLNVTLVPKLPKYDPLVVDLDNDGTETVSSKDGVYFDLDKDGFKEKTGWTKTDDGLLVMDRNNDGIINDGGELFGDRVTLKNGTKSVDGFHALGDIDENNDGIIDAKDSAFSKLRVWQDSNIDGISQSEELKTLESLDVESISLKQVIKNVSEVNRNFLAKTGEILKKDGEKMVMGEYMLITEPVNIKKDDVYVPDDILKLPDIQIAGRVDNLHQAMAKNQNLTALVKSFVAEKDFDVRRAIFGNIVYNWMGTSKPGIFNRIYGDNAHRTLPNTFEKWYNDLVDKTYSELMMQTHFKTLKESIKYTFNEDTKKWQKDYSGLITEIDNAIIADNANGKKILKEFFTVYNVYPESNEESFKSVKKHFVLKGKDFAFIVETAWKEAIYGTSEKDTLVGGIKDNIIYAGKGNDIISGGLGNDTYIFSKEDGQDVIGEYDTTPGNTDRIYLQDIGKNEVSFSGVNGNLEITINNSNDKISLRDFLVHNGAVIEEIEYKDNTIESIPDILKKGINSIGTENNDNVYGYSGDDTIEGKKGNDYLHGGAGNDTYIFSKLDGQDVIVDYDYTPGNTDRIHLQDIGKNEVSFLGVNDNLEIIINNSSDKISISNFLSNNSSEIEEIEYKDGIIEKISDILKKGFFSIVTENNDNVYGYSGNDTIEGKKGNDNLYGGAGNDTYIFSKLDGRDIIYENNSTPGNIDTIFLKDRDREEAVFKRFDNYSLEISFKDSTDTITINRYFLGKDSHIEQIKYKDNTTEAIEDIIKTRLIIESSDAGETISGYTGNDTIEGKKGDDSLYGETGNDTYIFSKGDGKDTIVDNRNENNRIVLNGVKSDEVTFTKDGNNLKIKYSENDEITINNCFSSNGSQIGEIEFRNNPVSTDNKIMKLSEVQLIIPTTTETDHVSGFAGKDYIDGKDGIDYIGGNDGNDTIIGGLGNDYLGGDGGNDTYLFSKGDGTDTIWNNSSVTGEQDKIKLTNVNKADVTILRDINNERDLIVKYTSEDSVHITDYFGRDTNKVALIEYMNGESENLIESVNKGMTFSGSDNGETLKGYIGKDVLTGNGGDDTIYGYGNDDTLFGNTGKDTLLGGEGKDELHGGTEIDKLFGEDGEDTLLGDAGDDYLSGGKDGDTYNFAVGDGNDTIEDIELKYEGDSAGVDILKMNNIKSTEVYLTKINPTDLKITISKTNESVIIKNYEDNSKTVDKVEFADGVVWNFADYNNLPTINNGILDGNKVWGMQNNDILSGSENVDNIYGYEGKDELYGNGGADTLDGGMGDDTLDGGAGNDTLYGGAGKNTYIIKKNNGNDIIKYTNATDIISTTLDFKDILSTEVSLQRFTKNDYTLEIKIIPTGEIITLEGYFAKQKPVTMLFSDGKTWDDTSILLQPIHYTNNSDGKNMNGSKGIDIIEGNELADTILGNEGDDTIKGGGGKDYILDLSGNNTIFGGAENDTIAGTGMIDGGTGDDTISGGKGSTVIFKKGSEKDKVAFAKIAPGTGGLISEFYYTVDYDTSTNIIKMEDIKFDDVEFRKSGKGWRVNTDLEIAVKGTNDVIKIEEYFSRIKSMSTGTDVDLCKIEFSDRKDITKADIINSGLKYYGTTTNDEFIGTTGNDTYILKKLAGTDILDDVAGNNIVDISEMSIKDITCKLQKNQYSIIDNDELLISSNAGADSLLIKNVKALRAEEATATIKFKFIEGEYTLEQLINKPLIKTGTENIDNLSGNDGNDEIYGLGGNDIINGLGGDDTIDGGKGEDTIYGGDGKNTIRGGDDKDTIRGGKDDDTIFGDAGNDDIYGYYGDNKIDGGIGDDNLYKSGHDNFYFGKGYGRDTIFSSLASDIKQIVLKDIIQNEISFARENNDFQIKINNSTDVLILKDYYVNSNILGGQTQLQTNSYKIEQIEFMDKSVLNFEDIPLLGTSENNNLEGGLEATKYIFTKGSGQDLIYDNGGIDKIVMQGIKSSEVSFITNGSSMDITINGASDKITIANYCFGGAIEQLEFDGGEIWTYEGGVYKKSESHIYGKATDDNLTGTENSDTIEGLEGNDVIDGKGGDDKLYGENINNSNVNYSSGNDDTYIFSKGTGVDTIFDYIGQDTIKIVGFTPDKVKLYSGADLNYNIEVRIDGIADKMIIKNVDRFEMSSIEKIVFDDGTIWDLQNGKVPIYTQGDTGTMFDDTLVFATGDEQKEGGQGNDTYFYSKGDGICTIIDYYKAGEINNLILKDINSNDVSLKKVGYNLEVKILNSKDKVIIHGQFSGNELIQNIIFANGEPWNSQKMNSKLTEDLNIEGTAAGEILTGFNGDDTVNGKGGDDSLYGGDGDDTYTFNTGDGKDTITDSSGIDTIKFGSGILEKDIQVSKNNQDIIIKTGAATVLITIKDYFSGKKIETVEFATGTKWNSAILESKINIVIPKYPQQFIFDARNIADITKTMEIEIVGTMNNNTGGTDWKMTEIADKVWILNTTLAEGNYNYKFRPVGTTRLWNRDGVENGADSTAVVTTTPQQSDKWWGTSGADTFNGTDINETILGGYGNDILIGGKGDDTYKFNLNDGVDIIRDISGTDTLEFGNNITEDTIKVTKTGQDLSLEITGTTDKVTIEGYFDGNKVETVKFKSGASWNTTMLESKLNINPYKPGKLFVFDARNVSSVPNNIDMELMGTLNKWTSGAEWKMEKISDKVWKKYVEIAAGTYDYKYRQYGTWNLNWNQDGIQGGSDSKTTVSATQEISNTIWGTSIADTLNGTDANETLFGGYGNDILIGGKGDDTYKFNLNDGADTIKDILGTDTLEFGESITEDKIKVTRSGQSLSVEIAGTTDKVTVDGYFDGNKVETVKFKNGVSWNTTTLESKLNVTPYKPGKLFVFDGRNISSCPNNIDIELMGTLNNWTSGANWKMDKIADKVWTKYVEIAAGTYDYKYRQYGSWSLNWNQDGIQGGSNSKATISATQEVSNTIWGTAVADTLNGTTSNESLFGGYGNDILTGGKGNDSLEGGAGDDTYTFAKGDGQDTITDISGNDILSIDANPLDLIMGKNGNDLDISIYGTTDKVTVKSWFTNTSNQIETIKTKDGNSLINTNMQQLIQAMATFGQDKGMSWSDAIKNKPEDVSTELAKYWVADSTLKK